MIKSWSSSYVYSNNNGDVNYTYNSNYKDHDKEHYLGLRRKSDKKNRKKKEMFYKINNDKKNKRRKEMLGKSNNNSKWQIENRTNNKVDRRFFDEYNNHNRHFKELDRRLKLPSLINENREHFLTDSFAGKANNNNLLLGKNMFNPKPPLEKRKYKNKTRLVKFISENQNLFDNDPFFK